jgi:TolA-binding protein
MSKLPQVPLGPVSPNSIEGELLSCQSSLSGEEDFAEQVEELTEGVEGIVLADNYSVASSAKVEELEEKIEDTQDLIEELKVKLTKLKNQLRREQRKVLTPTTATNAAIAVVVKNNRGKFYRQLHNEVDGTLYYFSDAGRKNKISLSAIKVPTAQVRASGHVVLDGKQGASIQLKDASAFINNEI